MQFQYRLKDHPRILEIGYRSALLLVKLLYPLFRLIGFQRMNRWLSPLERKIKHNLFGCKMCGQCILSSSGMTCPLTCPKEMRNGACGGVRHDRHCEVIPEMVCVWVRAYERARCLRVFGPEIIDIKAPLNHRLQGSSAWINMLTLEDRKGPNGWGQLPHNPVIERKLLEN